MPTFAETYSGIITGYLDLNTEISKTEPSTIVNLYEIDLGEIYPVTKTYSNNQPLDLGILRIHNDFNLFNINNDANGRIYWRGNYYYPMPIQVEGFRMSSSGPLATPKLSMSNFSPDDSYNSFYKYIRMQIREFGDLVGAKFTRIKTFLKYLHPINFSGGLNPFNPNANNFEIELPKEIYYIDRKNTENKKYLEYGLASVLDVENLYLPGRQILTNNCPFAYRGEGCCYEYNSRKTSLHSGVFGNTDSPEVNIYLLQTAPPVMTETDQFFIGGIFSTGDQDGRAAADRIKTDIGNKGVWVSSTSYVKGDFVFIEKNLLKYYFVCINNHIADLNNAPPNTNFWLADVCSKKLSSCRAHWLKNPAFKPVIWPTSRGGWDRDFFTGIIRHDGVSVLGTPAQGTPWSFPSLDEPVTNRFAQEINKFYNLDSTLFPRRPGCYNPSGEEAHGIPKDYQGNYLNGFLPFGGFPGTNSPSNS